MARRLLLVASALTTACLSADVGAQEQPPGSYAQPSAMMRDMRNFSAGTIEGSFYNEHPSKAIRIQEVTVTSSNGTRVFKFVCVLGPHESKEFFLATGLRLDFQAIPKTWWNMAATRATWAPGPSGQLRCPEQ